MAKGIAESFARAAGDNVSSSVDAGNKTAVDIEQSMFQMPKLEMPTAPRVDMQPAVEPLRMPEFPAPPPMRAGGAVQSPASPGNINTGFRIKFDASEPKNIKDPISGLKDVLAIMKHPYKFPKQ